MLRVRVEKHKFDVIIISDVVGGRLKAEACISGKRGVLDNFKCGIRK